VIRCVVESVRVHELTEQHVVNLKDDSGAILPIWIGPDTAFVIQSALAGSKSERPLTHDLLLSSFEKLGVRVARVAITGFVPFSDPAKAGGVFYATLYMEREAERIEIDSRPSDAIALAVRCDAQIFAADEVVEESSIEFQAGDEEASLVTASNLADLDPEEFRQFIETVTPEEFATSLEEVLGEPDDEFDEEPDDEED